MDTSRLAGNRDYQERIRAVLEHIEGHLAEELTVERLAGVACFSEFHFHRLFTAFMGESLNAYIRRLRLERAAILLQTYLDLSVTEIALESGFSSSATFARAFKQLFGLSASQWRAHFRKNGKTKSKPGKALPSGSPYPDSATQDQAEKGAKRVEIKVEIKELEPLTMAYVRHHGGYEEAGIHRAYEKLYKWAAPRGLFGPGTKVLGISLDNPEVTPAAKCRYDAGLTVPPGTEPQGEVGVREIPGGRHAVIRYQGGEEGLSGFYDAVYGGWLPGSGFQPADRHSYEIHHQAFEATDREGRCREGHPHFFDLCLPVEPL